MQRLAFATLAFLSSAGLVLSIQAQPPGSGEKKDKKGKDGKGPPPKFTPGTLFPPGLRDELNLTAEQQKEVAALEKQVREQLEKILSAEQKRTIEQFRPRPPVGPAEVPPPPREPKIESPQANADGGIQWYATLTSGLTEAKRTGKPILFLSAAPHCGGVPGMW